MRTGRGDGHHQRLVAVALTVGALLAGLTPGQSAARQTAHSATVPSTLFSDFKQLDGQLTTAVQEDQQAGPDGFPLLDASDVTQLEATTLALGNRYMQAPVYGVAGSTWLDALDMTERYLSLAGGRQTGKVISSLTVGSALKAAQGAERTLVNALKASGQTPSSVLADFRNVDGLITTAINDYYAATLRGPQIGYIAHQVMVVIHRSMLATVDGIPAYSWAGWLIGADIQLYRAYLLMRGGRDLPSLGGVTAQLQTAQKAERVLNHLLHEANPTSPTTATSTIASG